MRRTYLGIIVIIISILACACGQAASPVQAETKAEQTASAANTEAMEVEAGSDHQIQEKYSGLIDLLEKEDYDSAIAEIEKMKKASKAQKYGDVEDSLVTVELTKENFDEYFEFTTMLGKNAFGEYDDTIWAGLKSKKYDEGLILYNPYNKQMNDVITIEYTYGDDEWKNTGEGKLSDFLSFSDGFGGQDPETFSIVPTGRIAGSKITFIKKEFVESYEVEPFTSQDQHSSLATITLKNGESYTTSVNPDYLY